ncbi:MAG: cupin superfamily protein [Bradyrhizobium sp.]|nr:cupin superfamily protein [Bradyrhizobium sp.]
MTGTSILPPVAVRPLDFSLPSFLRMAWASAAAQAAWHDRLDQLARERRDEMIAGLKADRYPVILARMAPVDAVTASAALLHANKRAILLDPNLPRPPELIFGAPGPGIWAVLGAAGPAAEAAAAWRAADWRRLGLSLGRPACCAHAAGSDKPADRPSWAALATSPGPARAEDNYLMHRLGLAWGPWLPCGPECPATREIGPPATTLLEILAWPMAWSALHGIAELLAPTFRLTHDIMATADRHDISRGDPAQAPAETPVGVTFPYRRPRRTPMAARETFKVGLEHGRRQHDPIAVATIDRVPVAQFTTAHALPVIVDGAMDDWPALRHWTPGYLHKRLGDVPVVVRERDGTERTLPFAEMLAVAQGALPAAPYVLDFGFECFAPDMAEDCPLPIALASWHELLPAPERPLLRSLYLGGPGSGSPLHVDLLYTSAWNGVIWGRKRWALCPPGSDTRLVECEPDLFDRATRQRLSRRGLAILDCEQGPGDMLYVPSGWWHQVVNLVPTLSVTGNMLNSQNAALVVTVSRTAEHPRLKEIGASLVNAADLARARGLWT